MAWAAGLKSIKDHQQSQNIAVNFHRDFVADMLSDFFQRQKDMGAYSFGQTIYGKRGCPHKKKKKTLAYFL